MVATVRKNPSTLWLLLVRDFRGTAGFLFEFLGCRGWKERGSPCNYKGLKVSCYLFLED